MNPLELNEDDDAEEGEFRDGDHVVPDQTDAEERSRNDAHDDDDIAARDELVDPFSREDVNHVFMSSSIRRMSRMLAKQVQRRRSSVQETIEEALPDTPHGWAVLLCCVAATGLGYELRLQQHLTSPPLVYGQCSDGPLEPIYRQMTRDPSTSILVRPIQPSLVVGTRGLLSSMAAYFKLSPRDNDEGATTRCREIMTMTGDGATVAVDWEIPPGVNPNDVLQGDGAPPRPVVARPVVVIVHGINNDAEFGYIRSQMRACTDRGWIAAGFNMRACGKGVPVTTPRGYNGAFTGDIRCVVQHIAARLSTDGIGGDNNASNNRMSSCIFLVGHSLGANLVTKYLGEEGFSGTLPPCVAGGVGLGNPLLMNGVKKIDRLFSPIMALGAKKTILEHWFSIQPMTRSPSFRSAIHRALLAPTLAAFDNAMAPIFVRNEPTYPFSTRIGYESAEDYYNDASSFRHVPHIPIPTLQVVAADDFLVFVPFRGRLRYCLQNPNVMVVETKCGGHLGWQESPPDRSRLGLLGSSWADVVTCDFIEAVLDQRERRLVEDEKAAPKTQTCDIGSAPHAAAARFDDGSKLLRVHSRL